MGYHRADFEVIGVDIVPQPNYPFEFFQDDAFNWVDRLNEFDVIHASPPCQRFSPLQKRTMGDYPDLITDTREMLIASEKFFIIENVVQAPLIAPKLLCGSMFDLSSGEYQLRRHRHFETNWNLSQPSCRHKGYAIGVHGGGAWDNKTRSKKRGGYKGSAAECREAMNIDWMNRSELAQAIPPAYTEYIGKQLIDHIHRLAMI